MYSKKFNTLTIICMRFGIWKKASMLIIIHHFLGPSTCAYLKKETAKLSFSYVLGKTGVLIIMAMLSMICRPTIGDGQYIIKCCHLSNIQYSSCIGAFIQPRSDVYRAIICRYQYWATVSRSWATVDRLSFNQNIIGRWSAA